MKEKTRGGYFVGKRLYDVIIIHL